MTANADLFKVREPSVRVHSILLQPLATSTEVDRLHESELPSIFKLARGYSHSHYLSSQTH